MAFIVSFRATGPWRGGKLKRDAVPHLRLRLPNKRSRYKIGQAKSSKFPFWRGGGQFMDPPPLDQQSQGAPRKPPAAAIFAYLGAPVARRRIQTPTPISARRKFLRELLRRDPRKRGSRGAATWSTGTVLPGASPWWFFGPLSVHTERDPPPERRNPFCTYIEIGPSVLPVRSINVGKGGRPTVCRLYGVCEETAGGASTSSTVFQGTLSEKGEGESGRTRVCGRPYKRTGRLLGFG